MLREAVEGTCNGREQDPEEGRQASIAPPSQE